MPDVRSADRSLRAADLLPYDVGPGAGDLVSPGDDDRLDDRMPGHVHEAVYDVHVAGTPRSLHDVPTRLVRPSVQSVCDAGLGMRSVRHGERGNPLLLGWREQWLFELRSSGTDDDHRAERPHYGHTGARRRGAFAYSEPDSVERRLGAFDRAAG